MVENKSNAKNEAGKLFVDIGIGGIGKALKSLNSVSASFLLGKNAAMQFAQTISQPFKEAGKGAVEIGKMSNALATSNIEFQKLAQYLKNFNMSDALLGDVSKIQKFLKNASVGAVQISGEFARGLKKANIDATEFKNLGGSFQGAMKFFDLVQQKTAHMALEDRNQVLDWLGLNNDWGYLWDRGGKAGNYITIPDEEIEQLLSMQEAMNKTKETLEVLKNQFLAEIAPKIIAIADGITSLVQKFVGDNGVKRTVDATTAFTDNVIPKNGADAVARVLVPGYGAARLNQGINEAREKFKGKKQGSTMGGAAPIFSSDITEGASIPPGASGIVQNITNNINHDITINGDNPEAIANKIGSFTEQDIQYTIYDATNKASC